MAVGLVLLHSPLVGPGAWSELAPLLRARGHSVTVPDYSAVMQGPQPYYYEKIVSAAAMMRPDEPVVFVAHSGAGALIPALATKPGGQISGAIFMTRCFHILAIPGSIQRRIRLRRICATRHAMA